MYELINSHVDRLMSTVIESSDIIRYIWMLQELPGRDVSQDLEFQQKYCSHWALNGAGLGQSFRLAYFSLLQQTKSFAGQTSVESVTRTLNDVPVNATDRKALQFSFASKLVHMV